MEQIFSTYVSINRIRLEFKGGYYSFMGSFNNTGINRNRLEFKGYQVDKDSLPFQVLIESDWNLKMSGTYPNFVSDCSINRIRLEFKGSTT